MGYRIQITTLAEEEYSSAFWFYEEKQIGLGEKFEKETEKLINQLSENPYLFQRRYKHYREAVYKHFPYFIVYELVGEGLVVIHSFFHSSRYPEKKLKSNQ